MKIIYFLSPQYPYETVIYSGVGPRYAKAFGWPTASLDRLSETECDIGIVDNRLMESDFELIERFLASPRRRLPLFFKLSDPDMPTYDRKTTRYILEKKDTDGVHYISIYDPEGPLREFVSSLQRSKVVRLPYPYDRGQEVERDFEERKRAVFLSGAHNSELYPLRALLRRQRAINPLARFTISILEHPGYPEYSSAPSHDFMFERFVEYASRFSHFLLCPSRYRIELMKYVECAYAGCVPIGEAPTTLKEITRDCFIAYTGHPKQLVKEILSDKRGMLDRATEYRQLMRMHRDPVLLQDQLVEQVSAIL